MDKNEEIIKLLKEYNQEHIIELLNKLDENKKEELFNNDINASISTGDISSNIDLGGLDGLLGMTEAKILEAKNNIKYNEVEYNKANKEVNN